jgi:hypothetical protein
MPPTIVCCQTGAGMTPEQLELDGRTWVPLDEVSELLDEVFQLRRALAYESQVIEAQVMDVKALGQGRRGHVEDSIERMILAALGDSSIAYAGTSSISLRHAIRSIGAQDCLTRWNWRNWRVEAKETND